MGVRKYATEEERKAARREACRRWREANPEKARESRRRYRKANPEKAREACRRWHEANPDYHHQWAKANPEKVREASLRYRKANLETVRERDRRWSKVNPEKARANYHRRRARKLNQHGLLPVTAKVVNQRFELFGHACAYCGAQHDLQADHFIPLSQGGTHAPSNLVPACPSCNYSKGDSDPEQWYRQQPSFNEQRWKQIQKATGHHKAPGQLALV